MTLFFMRENSDVSFTFLFKLNLKSFNSSVDDDETINNEQNNL